MGLRIVSDYTTIPSLANLYLEDSFVLAITRDEHELSFHIEAVVTEGHPLYHEPKPGQQYCYIRGQLTFSNAERIEWIKKANIGFRDANEEEDLGNIDFLNVEADNYHVGGDWGEVKVYASAEPVFEPETTKP
jgi:hypothetical protein